MSKSPGVALIMVLLVLSIATAVSITAITRQHVGMKIVGYASNLDNLWLYAKGIDAWAMGAIRAEPYPGISGWVLPLTEVTGGTLEARIIDLQGRFNLNGLVNGEEPDAVEQARFQRLIRRLSVPEEIGQKVLDWIDADSNARFPVGAEDDVYTRKRPPYKAANRPLVDVSELLLIEGVSRSIYLQMADYVTAFAGRAPINVNSASIPVLLSLSDDMTESIADALIARREAEPFTDVGDFLAHPMLSELDIDAHGLTTGSRYFQVDGRVVIDSVVLNYSSILLRQGGGVVRVVQRSRRN